MASLIAMVAAFTFLPVTAHADQVDRCKVTDKRIGELSGLVSDGQRMYAINDGGTKLTVYVLAKDCKVERTIANKTDPFDVEDLARATDGTFWLADIGDNDRKRETIALHALTPDGRSTLYRLTYPDGAHDAEAILLDRKGVPYIVTKAPFGPADVYRPAGRLASPGPTELTKVASISLAGTDTPGGPTKIPRSIGSILVTGGAVNADGTVVAIRTYNDAYLYSAPDGDITAAFGRKPVRVPLPDEPQGESIAFDPDGTLLSASEGVGQPIRAVAGAAALVAPAPQPQPGGSPSPAGTVNGAPATNSGGGLSFWPAVGVAGVVVLGGAVLMGRRRRR
jgi:hypothetical protein